MEQKDIENVNTDKDLKKLFIYITIIYLHYGYSIFIF